MPDFTQQRDNLDNRLLIILQEQKTLCGVNSLSPSAYGEIVELLIEQLGELELSLASREITEKHEPQ